MREALEAFVQDAVYELGEHARRRGAAYGPAVVLRRVGREHGVRDSAGVPLPRPTRAEMEATRWEAGDDQQRARQTRVSVPRLGNSQLVTLE